MYEISIDTSKYESKNRRDWDNQLYNDICVRLNGLSWEYKTKSGLRDRFLALQGKGNSINMYSDNNCVTLKDERYGTQRVNKALPGICTGYISWEKIEQKLERDGLVRICFTSFYDVRALNKSLGLEKCYVVIRKI